MSSLITVFVVLQVVIWPGASELGQVLLVVELQEVRPFAAETQEGRRQAARQGHEPPGAANAEGKTVTHKYIVILSVPPLKKNKPKKLHFSCKTMCVRAEFFVRV